MLYGACDGDVPAPYAPFVEALGQLERVLDPDELREALGTSGAELTRLLPDLPVRATPVRADPDTERHRLHIAVTDLLTEVSRRRPVLLVLEDAHWADVPTLSLLRHLGRAGGRARVLLLATFRETEAGDALSDALADLRRSEDVVRLRLEGLTGEEVAEFVRQASGGDGADLAQAISELTSGNPFLVCELWRSLADTGELGTPESVREVVGQRLARLRPATSDLLELAATAGAEFDLETLGLAAEVPDAELLSALDEAVRSGMIEELPSRRLAYRFTHELFRRALYDRLTGLRRAELHLRFGEALERSGGGRDVAELAYHFAAAAPFGGTARGVEYNVLAARAAAAALDFDDAAERLRVALELGVQEPLERGELLLELGGAGHRGGRLVDALAAFTEAAEIGRATGDADLLARAAIGYEEACWRPVITDRAGGRAARGGGARPRRRGIGGPRGRPGRARARAPDPRPARARRRRAGGGGGDGARPRRPRRAGHGAGGQLLVTRDDVVAAGAGEAQRGARHRRRAGGRRAPLRGDELARLLAGRGVRPRLGPARDRGGPRDGRADGAAVSRARGRALRLCHRVVRGTAGRRRGDGHAVARVEPAPDRPRRVRRARDPDVQRPARAGQARRAGAAGPPARDPGPVATGPGRSARRAGHGDRGTGRARARGVRRARRVPRLALARVADLPHRRVRGPGRRGDGRAGVSGARPVRRWQRDDRPRGRVLRSRRPLPRDARRDPRRVGASGAALRARHGAEPAHGSADVGRAHRVRARADAAPPRRSAPRAGRRRCSARRPRWPRGSACRRC